MENILYTPLLPTPSKRTHLSIFHSQVKLFFTHRTTAVLLLGIFLYQAVVLFTNFWAFSVKLETSQATNITNLVLDVSTFDEQLNALAYFYAIAIPSVVCMVTIVVGTTLLIVKLKKSAQWRMSTVTTANSGARGSMKEIRLIRIVVFICIIFIVCFSPNILLFLTAAVYPRFAYRDPQFRTLFTITGKSALLFQLISCSLNFFVYFKMNSKFRTTLMLMFSNTKSQ